MAKTLHADGANGHIYIFNGNFSEVSNYQNPTPSQLGSLYFHSDLSYFANTQVIETAIAHPQRTRSTSKSKWGGTHYNLVQSNQVFVLGNHSLGASVPAIGFIGNAQMSAGNIIQQVGQSVRSCSIFVNSNSVQVHEQFITVDDTLPAINQTYKVYLFQNLSSNITNVALSATPTSLTAGFGKLNTAYKYVRRQGSTPSFYLGKDKTADVANGGLKIVLPNGVTSYQSSNYNGTFSGTVGTGAEI